MNSDFSVRNSITGRTTLGRLWHDKLILYGKAGQIGVIPEVEFPQQSEPVSVDGLDADIIGLGNFPIRLSQRNTSQHLNLSIGQAI